MHTLRHDLTGPRPFASAAVFVLLSMPLLTPAASFARRHPGPR